MRGSSNFTDATQITRKPSFENLRVKGVIPSSSSLDALGGKPSLAVATILFFHLLHRTKTTANEFGTTRLELSSTLLETLNFRLGNKEGLKLTFLTGLGFEEISFQTLATGQKTLDGFWGKIGHITLLTGTKTFRTPRRPRTVYDARQVVVQATSAMNHFHTQTLDETGSGVTLKSVRRKVGNGFCFSTPPFANGTGQIILRTGQGHSVMFSGEEKRAAVSILPPG
jgi:hypothetical protein